MKHFKKHFPILGIIFLVLFTVSCGKEAPTVNPGDYTSGGEGTPPGYFYPFVTAVYPTGTGVPVNTNYVIVFNMPVDADDFASQITVTGAGVPSYSFTPITGASTTATITFASQLPAGTDFTVTVGSGIHELVSVTSVPIVLTAGVGYTWTFQTGAAPDVTVPIFLPASRTPADGSTDISITSPGIQIEFSEPVNPSTINSSTFSLQRIDVGPTSVPAVCDWSPAANPTIATLTPLQPLEPSTVVPAVTPQYRVTVTTGITDIAGNNLSAGTTWTFTTESGDPDPGAPSITVQPSVSYVTNTTADISWTTNEATQCTLRYGQGDTTISSVPPTVYSSFHSLTLAALSPGRRYYARMLATDYVDYAGYSGLANSTTAEFNTETNEVPSNLDNNDNSQSGVNWITSNANSGAFLFWRELSGGNYHLYGKLVDSSFGNVAGWGSRLALYNGSTTQYLSAAEDGMGGVIVLATSGASGIYAKRISNIGEFSNSNFNWGATADDAGDAGLSIGTGTNAKAVPVYSGLLNQLASGTITMSNLPNANVFYDFNPTLNNLSNATNGDIVIDMSNGQISTVTVPFSNFARHTLYQNSIAVSAVENYRLIDADAPAPGTSDYSLANGTTIVYASTNSFTAPGWLTAAAGYNGDLMEVNGVYAFITALNTSSPQIVSSGTSETYNLASNHLVNSGANWGSLAQPVAIGDTVENTDTPATATVTNVTATDLTLSANIFYTSGGENYEITGTVDSGTNDLGVPTVNHLIDSLASWVGVVAINDTVENTDTPATALVTNVTATDLTLDTDIFQNIAGGEGYHIYRTLTGTSTVAAYSNILYDSGASWGDGSTGPVYVGNTVTNTSTSLTATVTAVTNNQLTLSANRFSPSGGEGYEINDTFYRFTLSTPVDILTDQTFNLYDNTAIAAGQADNVPANPLYDNAPTTLFTTLGVAAGDIVFNYTDGTVGQVDSGFTVSARALGVDSSVANMFANGEAYRLFEFLNNNSYADIVTTGIATGGTATTLVNTGTNFTTAGVAAGDIAYNVNDSQYAMITAVAATTLTLSRDATFGNGDRYIIIDCASVLYVWQSGANINASLRRISTGTSLSSISPLIANAQNPHLVPDGNGNAIIVYETTASPNRVVARRINSTGGTDWTTNVAGAPSGINESIVKMISDNAGGVIVLYRDGGSVVLRAQRISGAGTRQWNAPDANGYNFANTAAIDSIASVDMAYNGTNDLIVTAQIGNKVWANRVNAGGAVAWVLANRSISNPSTGTQNRPKIFVNAGWTTATIVWEDSRFLSSAGYGIFGMQVNAGTGEKAGTWRANSGGTDDYNGISVVLNAANVFVPNHVIIPYNAGAGAMLIWEDVRNNTGPSPVTGSDLLYIDVAGFTP